MRGRLAVLVGILAACWGSPAWGQNATADFNGDGFDDLAIGVPAEDLFLISLLPDTGIVNVLYGSRAGLSETGVQTLVQGGTSETNAGDNFGSALAAGDFNGDGFDDLAVGVPGKTVNGHDDAGVVDLFYGSPSGLTAPGGIPEVWSQDSANVEDGAEPGDRFGSALVAANFGKGSRTDLAIGSPTEDIGTISNAGSVNVLFGRAGGLSARGDQFWHQDSAGIVNTAEANDDFGFALAAANFGKSGDADLAVGVPDEDFGAVEDAGGVNVIYGSRSGLSAAGDQFWSQDRSGVAESAEAFDAFGIALAAANFGKSTHADLAVGASSEDVGGVIGGAVNVLYGTSSGLSASGDQFWHQNSSGIADAVEGGDLFGIALASANFGKSSHADLAIGAPLEGLAFEDAGAVHVIYGGSTGLASRGDQFWHQNTPSIGDAQEGSDQFGRDLTAGNFGSNGLADLAVGIPFEDVASVVDAGAVSVIFATSSGLSAFGDEYWHQDSDGVASETAETGDVFGRVLVR